MTEPQSLWSRILNRVSFTGISLRKPFAIEDPTDSVAFSISFIALSAKLAKADGLVTRDEVRMFRRIFEIPPHEEANVARVYNLCRQETSGYESYAKKLHRCLGRTAWGDDLRLTVLDGLFHIAMADGEFHPQEEEFLQRVSTIFEIEEEEFRRLIAQHVPEHRDPWMILGVEKDADIAEIRAAWRAIARDTHPDRMRSKGLPPEMITLAEARLSEVNVAYAEIMRLKKPDVSCSL